MTQQQRRHSGWVLVTVLVMLIVPLTSHAQDNVPVRIPAACIEWGELAPAPTTQDAVIITWMWWAQQPEQVNQHLENSVYKILLDGVSLPVNDAQQSDMIQRSDGNWMITWELPIEPLSAGAHEITYQVTWRVAITDGVTEYGPGTEKQFETGHCSINVLDEGVSASSAPVLALSDQQNILIREFGYPDAFVLAEVDGTDEQVHRLETWTYYSGNTTFVFLDGVFQRDETVEYPSGGVMAAHFRPDQFSLGVPLAALQTQFPQLTWATLADDSLAQSGLQLLASEQLMIGFKDNQLVYVETIALAMDGGNQQ